MPPSSRTLSMRTAEDSGRGRHSAVKCFAPSSNMQPMSFSRLLHKNGNAPVAAVINSMHPSPLPVGSVRALAVKSVAEYMAGCTLGHKGCFGHISVTPYGTPIVPHHLANIIGSTRNLYAMAAESAFDVTVRDPTRVYNAQMERIMLTKHGAMRNGMASKHIDGSARLVIIPEWRLKPGEVAIPRHIAGKMVTPIVCTEESCGCTPGTVHEATVKDGDWVLLHRPPSLWHGSIQPRCIVLWDRPCIGLNPYDCDAYHADFDGDEQHIQPIKDPKSIAQCESWQQLYDDKFDAYGRRAFHSRFQSASHMMLEDDPSRCDVPAEFTTMRNSFMIHENISFHGMMRGDVLTDMHKGARMKPEFVDRMVQRMRSADTEANAVEEMRRGMMDVMKQQLSQGYIGNLSRMARLAASSVCSVDNVPSVTTMKGVKALGMTKRESDVVLCKPGNACIRAVNVFGSLAQQAALDSHRASENDAGGDSMQLDLIESVMAGTDRTLIVVHSNSTVSEYEWRFDVTYNDSLHELQHQASFYVVNARTCTLNVVHIIGTYSPIMLRRMHVAGMTRCKVSAVCRRGLMTALGYYSTSMQEDEALSLSYLMAFAASKTSKSVLTKEGMFEAEIEWMTTLFAHHFTFQASTLHHANTPSAPSSITAAMATGNFDHLM